MKWIVGLLGLIAVVAVEANQEVCTYVANMTTAIEVNKIKGISLTKTKEDVMKVLKIKGWDTNEKLVQDHMLLVEAVYSLPKNMKPEDRFKDSYNACMSTEM